MTSWLILVVAIAYILIAIGAICVSSPGLRKCFLKIRSVLARTPRPPASAAPDDTNGATEAATVGEFGVAYTPLNPHGKAWFGPSLLEVVAEDPPVEAGATVCIVARDGKRVVVRAE